jgi:dihydrofolate reductase
MIVSLIAAIDRNLVIGDATGIPWHLPADLKRFRRLTMGKPIVMGRTTFAHIGRPLDGRTNIVLSRRSDFRPDGVLIAGSIREAIELAGEVAEIFVIGGGEVYRAALPLVRRMHLTLVDSEFAGTVHFPEFIPSPPGHAWRETSREAYPADEKNPYAHQYVVEVLEKSTTTGPELAIRSLWR